MTLLFGFALGFLVGILFSRIFHALSENDVVALGISSLTHHSAVPERARPREASKAAGK